MNAKQTFDHLRKLARAKRDQDIEFAKASYQTRLAQILALERDLSFVDPAKAKTPRANRSATKAIIENCAPSDDVFTLDELLAIIAESDFHPPSKGHVCNTLRKMVKNNEFKEVINRDSRLIKKYARPHVDAEAPLPPLGISVAEVLKASNAPMRPIEIAVSLIESGNPIEGEDPTAAVGKISQVLREHPDKFKETDNGYWKSI